MLTLFVWPAPHHTVSETLQARHLEFNLLVKIVCCTIYHDISGLCSWLFLVEVIESLSNKEGDGYGNENVTQKVNLRFLNLYRACSISFNSSNLGNFFLELNSKGLYQSSRNEKESCCLVWPSSTKREIMQFHDVVVQRRLRNVQKKRDQSCCFTHLNFLGFLLPFSLPSPSSLLKLPNV